MLLLLVLACAGPGKGEGADDSGTAGPTGPDADGDRSPDEEDCDPDDPTVYPGADEVCDGKDNDCDGQTDDGFPATVWHPDADGDGYGDGGISVISCLDQPGHVTDASDCDDGNATVYPGAAEICNDGVVQDCGASEAEARAECALAGDVTLGSDGLSLHGDEAGDRLGAALAAGSFLDAPTLAVGAPGRTSNGRGSGSVWLTTETTGEVDVAASATRVDGLATGVSFGAALANPGDVDGDGLDDLLVGSPEDDVAGNQAGAAWILRSPVSSGPASAVGWQLLGAAEGDRAGASVAGLGDVTGDGVADWAVGAWSADSNGPEAGAVYLYTRPIASGGSLGSADLVLSGASAYQYAGWSVAGAGDVDGDGLGELLVGTPKDVVGGADAGAAYLVATPASGSLGTHGVAWRGAAGELAGTAVAGSGDVNGDGYADLAVGAPSAAGGAGAVYLLAGPALSGGSLASAGTVLVGLSPGDAAGTSVAGLGDVDGDDRADLLVGGPGLDAVASEAGGAWLVVAPGAGTVYLSLAAATLAGPAADGLAGSAVATAGDLDEDGFPDLFVGGPGEAYGDVIGSAWVLAGAGP